MGYPRGGGAGAGGHQVSEAQRVMERLRNLHSSGEVVPLPFLQATDSCPLSLLGLDGGGAHYQPNKDNVEWEGVLRQVLAESDASDVAELPPAAVERVKNSSTLLNLALALAHRKEALDWQREEGASAAELEHLQSKAEALSDTLRTVLCL